MRKQNPKLTTLARNLRKHDSWGERLVWRWLRDRRFNDYKFRREFPKGPHILDFFCREASLDIEVDGFQHGRPEHQAADIQRDAWLASQGIKVLRFWSSRLRRDKQMIRDAIWAALCQRAPHPEPSCWRRGPASSPQDLPKR